MRCVPGTPGAAAECFAEDAVFRDQPSHIQVVGRPGIGRFLAAAGTRLPYAGTDIRGRHVLTGGYERVGPVTTASPRRSWTAVAGSPA